ncbi:MAG: penicillin-binding protein 1B [Myxococcota bacterium]|jgi:penicillin-binding protein 1B
MLGALVGGATISYVLYHQAVIDVDDLLSQEVWSATGRVLSAPLAVWPKMTLTPGQLAEDLQSAGYARVRSLQAAGDFTVTAERIQILAETGETISIRFDGGRVSGVQPGPIAHLGAVELAELRGPEGISRRPITVDELPEHVYKAVLAMEDSRFFDHEGVDPIGIGRAIMANVTQGGITQGGSTLTQQLVKNLFLSAERTYERKAREALLAVALENTRSKRAILELYLNEIYLGQIGGASIAGIDQAARAYFGKGAERLELGEAAVLAGIISAPNRYSPLRHPERALERRDRVLDRMADLEWITAEQRETEQARPLSLAPTPTHRQGPWMVEAAVEQVESAVGEEGVISGQGWVVQTTLQPTLQRIAERVVRESLAALASEHDIEGAEMALVALRASDGAVLAMVGGSDYATSQFNRVTSAERQIGSTVKPLTYLAALDRDHTLSPGTLVEDAPLVRTVNRKTWSPKNYDGRYVGPISYRDALARSRNVPAVLVAESVGMTALQAWWRSAGLEGATDYPSAALGSFEATPLALAASYTVFPNGGAASRPRLVTSAVDADGEARYTDEATKQRLAGPEATWMVTSMMKDVLERGTGRSAARYGLDGPAAGKTGTTDDARDAWFAGFTGDVVVVVWVGHDRDRPLGLTGSEAALPAWTRFIVDSGLPLSLAAPPSGLSEETLCRETGLPSLCAGPCEEAYTEWVFADVDVCDDVGVPVASANPLRAAISRLLSGEPDRPPEATAPTPESEDAPRRIFPRRRR